MTVTADNGKNTEYAVGLVGVSSWQGWLWHSPKNIGVQQEGIGASNLYRAYSTFTWANPKGFTGYFKNGHVALTVRQQGKLTHVVGFNPESYLLAGLLQTVKGNNITVKGLWYDDTAMIHDPTAISYEIVVTQQQAQAVGQLLASLIGRSDLGPHGPTQNICFYSFRPAVTEIGTGNIVGNCSNFALLILCQYLYEWGKPEYVDMFRQWINLNITNRNFGQGPLMGAISQGFKFQ